MNAIQALPDHPIEAKQPDDDFYEIWQLLESVPDPEIPVVNLRELGILRDIRQGSEGIEVVLTPTYSGCPAMSQMEDDVKAALAQAQIPAKVLTLLSPAWSTDWMTPAARRKLSEYGIAPPQVLRAQHEGLNVIQFIKRQGASQTPSIKCPQCGSTNTTETSHFGSTACKALYRCLDCMEPFDYFKPY